VVATLPSYPGATRWVIDGTPFPFAESLSVRLPAREVTLELLLDNGRTLNATWTPDQESAQLSLDAFDALLHAGRVHSGHLSAVQLQTALTPGQPGWQRCFEHALKTDPELRPSLTLRVELAATGKIHHSTLAGELQNKEFRRCLDRTTRGLRFPSPGGPLTFEVPLSFRHRMP